MPWMRSTCSIRGAARSSRSIWIGRVLDQGARCRSGPGRLLRSLTGDAAHARRPRRRDRARGAAAPVSRGRPRACLDLGTARDHVPDRRRRHRPCLLLPAHERRMGRAAGRAAAAPGDLPRRAHRRIPTRISPSSIQYFTSRGIGGRRRQLPRQHGLRTRVPPAPRRPVGRDRLARLHRRGAPPRRARRGRPARTWVRGRERRRLRRPLRADVRAARVRRGRQPLRRRRRWRRSRSTRTSSSRATWTRSSAPIRSAPISTGSGRPCTSSTG